MTISIRDSFFRAQHSVQKAPTVAMKFRSFGMGSIGGFTAVWVPGYITIAGDVGELIIHHGNLYNLYPGMEWIIGSGDDEYLLGKSSAKRVVNTKATAEAVVELADDLLSGGDTSLWEKLCEELDLDDRWLDEFLDDGSPRPTEVADSAVSEAVDRSEYFTDWVSREIQDGWEMVVWEYTVADSKRLECAKIFADWVISQESVAAKLWRRSKLNPNHIQKVITGLKSRPITWSPIRYRDRNGVIYYRKKWADSRETYMQIRPVKLFGFDISGLGFWRHQGSSSPGGPGSSSFFKEI